MESLFARQPRAEGQKGISSSRSARGGGRAFAGSGMLLTTNRFKMSSRSIKMIWLRLVASSLLPSQFRAALVISPPATI